MTDAVRRILIVRLSHLGDVVHALPVFHALRAAYPRAEIGWAVQREFAELVRGLPGLARTFELDRRGGVRAWFTLRRELAAWRADWAIDAQGNWKSAGVARISGAARRTGLHTDDWRERSAALLSTEHAARARGPHAVERTAALVEHVAGTTKLSFDFASSAEELARARAELAQRVAPPFRVTLLHLATSGDVRAWPAGRFAELARELSRHGERVLVLSGPAEAGAGAELARELAAEPHVTHWIGQRGLRTLAGVFTLAARDGATFVGCDSGPLHVAWACGLRTVCLAGPQDARRTGPWPPPRVEAEVAERGPHAVVRAHEEPACAPCFARRCTHAEGPVCMSRITPDDVLAALLAEKRESALAARSLRSSGSIPTSA